MRTIMAQYPKRTAFGGQAKPPAPAWTLADVVQWGKGEYGKPYSGPIVGEPESWRYGNPGYDCSSFVRTGYGKFGVTIGRWAYTDEMYDNTDPAPYPMAGLPLFYRYYDESQPQCSYPHMGLWMPNGLAMECRYSDYAADGGRVGLYPRLSYPFEVRIPKNMPIWALV